MLSKHLLRVVFLATIILFVKTYALAQTDQIEHIWYNQEKTAKIQVYKATDGKYYGKIIWLKIPDVDGKVKVDINNPDKKKRNEPLLGLLILKGLKKENNTEYEDGTIYDPKNGKTYSCNANYKGNILNLRGYYGFSWIGRTTTWTRADN
ncbi:MAG TPA: DUF2147 domain-containing protein [Flavipsychrobacter sp.]|nr:DUF2147 domain-containing protein [Flavipsychrobacter sp.]